MVLVQLHNFHLSFLMYHLYLYIKTGPWYHQVFSSHNISMISHVGRCFSWGRVEATYAISVRMDNQRWKNTTMFHEQYSIYKGLNVLYKLTHYGLVMPYGVGNFCQHQFNADFVSIGTLGTNFSEIGIKIQNFSFMKMHLKMSSAKWLPFCPGRYELKTDHVYHWLYL